MPVYKGLFAALIALGLLAALTAGLAAAAPVNRKVLIQNVKENGTLIILTDGSEYRVPNPDDQQMVYDWLPFQSVLVKGDKEMVNLQRGDIVNVRQTKPPQVTAQAPAAASGSAASSAGGTSRPVAASLPPDLAHRLDKVLKRLEDIEFSLKAMELRLQRLERMAGVQP